MPIEATIIILAIVTAVVWFALVRDVVKYPEVPDKCKYCIDRWNCNGECKKE